MTIAIRKTHRDRLIIVFLVFMKIDRHDENIAAGGSLYFLFVTN